MIPKIIHYCWFGGNPLPELAIKCISSWKRYFPDYEIKEWNESNFDIKSCDYCMEAYKAKKWAFVSDYARFKILYKYGGLYFDTDVEIIKSMEDIVQAGSFMGCEKPSIKERTINPGLGLAAAPGLGLYKIILDDYEKSHFINDDGSKNYLTVVDRTTNILKKYGFKEVDELQEIKGKSNEWKIIVYPSEYFCPMSYETGELIVTDNSRSIHWYDASWLDKKMQRRHKHSARIRKMFKGRSGEILSKLYMSISYYWEWLSTGNWNIIKEKIKKRINSNH